ncbi:MAG: hypothetical protein R2779_08375 [Crocinitomicaceae bacterium]
MWQGLYIEYVRRFKGVVVWKKTAIRHFKSFNKEIIEDEELVPVMLINQETRQVIGTNINDSVFMHTDVNSLIRDMSKTNDSIVIDFSNNVKNVLYFDSSPVVKQLQYFPYIQFVIIGLFVFIAYLLFSTFRKAEQNQVWAEWQKNSSPIRNSDFIINGVGRALAFSRSRCDDCGRNA